MWMPAWGDVGSEVTETQQAPDTGSVSGEDSGSATLRVVGMFYSCYRFHGFNMYYRSGGFHGCVIFFAKVQEF